MRSSLRTRLVLLVAMLLALVALALLIFLPARIESRSRSLVEGRAIGIATLLAQATGTALEFDDESSAAERLGQMASTPDALYATVARADGTALASWRSVSGHDIPMAPVGWQGVTINDSLLHVVVPITTKGGTQGSLAVGFTLEELEREKEAAFHLVWITSLIVLAVGLAVTFVIGTFLVRPITKMTQVALRISNGEDAGALDTSRRDEVGTMARAFALMLDKLDRQRSFLACQSEASGDGILIISNELELISCNPKLFEQFSLPELPTRDARIVLGYFCEKVADPDAFRTRAQYIEAHPDEEATDEIRLLDGRVFERYTAPIKSAEGIHFGRGWYFHEITDRTHAEEKIRALNSDLEHRVEERTQALGLANGELAARYQQLKEAQRQLIEASRKSGMADVATAVLHNVGNVLNSVNVSANLIHESFRGSRLSNLRKAVDLLSANSENLGAFMTTDPRGQKLSPYLSALAANLDTEREVVTKELSSLQSNIDHIKTIVSRQQSNAKHGGVLEEIAVDSLMDDALSFNTASHAHHGITVIRDYQATTVVTCDRHKALQVVMNFLSNAKQAVESNPAGDRRVTVRTRMNGNSSVVLEVQDNGVGIAPENLGKIFGLGFTTKPSGHGFGLHSSACCAIEMGGSVGVESEGLGEGACFRLTMPVSRKAVSAA